MQPLTHALNDGITDVSFSSASSDEGCIDACQASPMHLDHLGRSQRNGDKLADATTQDAQYFRGRAACTAQSTESIHVLLAL